MLRPCSGLSGGDKPPPLPLCSGTLILGGARSGKSRQAERLATASGWPVTYVATATAQDSEMAARIAAHRASRPAHWVVVEEPLHVARALAQHAGAGQCVIVDCLTLWLCNVLAANDDALFAHERAALLAVLPTVAGQVILVSNETNLGVVPLGALSRRFCDEAGWLHQDLAAQCDCVMLMVAGLPLLLKGNST